VILVSWISNFVCNGGLRFGIRLLQTDFACKVYMFEEDYVEYLVVGGHLPRYCSRFRSAEVSVGAVKAKDGHDMLAAVEGVQTFTGLLQSAIASLNDVEAKLKAPSQTEAKMDRIGERLLILGVANLVVVALVLMVLICK